MKHVAVALAVLGGAVAQDFPWLPEVPACEFSVELSYIQDFSGSFKDDKVLTATQLMTILNRLYERYPESRTALGTFVDKPVEPLGFPYQGPWFDGDWCLDVSHKFGHGLSVEDLVRQYFDRQDGGGNDWPENQLGALHDVARGDHVGWSTGEFTEGGLPIVRLIVLSTDYMYHVAGDGLPYGMKPNDGDGTTDCLTEDYPSVDQVRSAILDRGAFLAFLVGDGSQEDMIGIYKELFDAIGVDGGVFGVRQDGTDALIAAFTEIFRKMEAEVCGVTLDVAFSQDVTYSYNNDMPNFQTRMTEMMGKMAAQFPKSRFGLTSFADKPLMPLGHAPSGDFCYRFGHELSTDQASVQSAANQLKTVSGIDWKESQLDATISSALDPALGWRAIDYDEGLTVVRIVMIATDAGFHIKGDALKEGIILAPHTGGITTVERCTLQEYPTVEQMAAALLSAKVFPVFVPTSDIASIYRKLVEDLAVLGVDGAVVELADFGGDIVKSTQKTVKSLVAKVVGKGRAINVLAE